MTIEGSTITEAQRGAARAAGAILLIAMTTAMFAELHLLRGIGSTDPAVMVENLRGMEGRYRAGLTLHLLTFASDAAIAAALFRVLSPVALGWAAAGALLRIADAAVLALSMALGFAMLRLVGLTPALPVPETLSLVRWLYGVQGDVMRMGWIFLGIGQAVFAVVWWRSRYIPRALAGWGVFASTLLAAGPVANLLSPGLVPPYATMAPMFFYEVLLGLWLLARGLSPRPGQENS